MKIIKLLAPLLLLLVSAMALTAEEPKPGKIVTVKAKHDSDQKYSCYLPSDYTDERPWPIIFCFAPNGDGAYFVKRLKPLLEKHGWIAAGSLNSRNRLENEQYEIIQDALWKDTNERFNLSENMRYATGFSGGARVSFWLEKRKNQLDGIFAMGAGLSDYQWTPPKDLSVYWTCGKDGFNHPELTQRLDPILQENGNPVKSTVFDGGHEPPPSHVWKDAIEYLDRFNIKIGVDLYKSQTEIVSLLWDRKYVKAYKKAKKTAEEGNDAQKLLDRLKEFYKGHQARILDLRENSFQKNPIRVLDNASRVLRYFEGYPPASDFEKKVKKWEESKLVKRYRKGKKKLDEIETKIREKGAFLTEEESRTYVKQLKDLAETYSDLKIGTLASDDVRAIQEAFDSPGYMGIIPDREHGGSGIRIGGVRPETPASKSGLQKGDVLLKANGTKINNLRDLRSVLKNTSPGDTLKLQLKGKGDSEENLKMTLGVNLSL